MPLTKSGKKILRKFQKEYGKIIGTRAFYSYMNKYKNKTKRWHK